MKFNTMSALFVHQSPTLLQKIDSRGRLVSMQKGVSLQTQQNEFLFKNATIYTIFRAIYR